MTELVDKMKEQRKPNGATESVGPVLVEWVCFDDVHFYILFTFHILLLLSYELQHVMLSHQPLFNTIYNDFIYRRAQI